MPSHGNPYLGYCSLPLFSFLHIWAGHVGTPWFDVSRNQCYRFCVGHRRWMSGGGLTRDSRVLLPVLSRGRWHRRVLRWMGWLMGISSGWRAPLRHMGRIAGITRWWGRILRWMVLGLFVRRWNGIWRRRRRWL